MFALFYSTLKSRVSSEFGNMYDVQHFSASCYLFLQSTIVLRGTSGVPGKKCFEKQLISVHMECIDAHRGGAIQYFTIPQ